MHPIVPWLIGLRLLLPLPLLLANAYTQYVVNVICINVILAVGLNIVKGFAGQVTVGHIALAAIGAYASAVFATKLGFPFWGALPARCCSPVSRARSSASHRSASKAPTWRSPRSALPNPCASSSPARTGSAPQSATRASLRPIIGSFALDDHRSYYYVVMPIALLGLYFSFSILSSDIGRAFKALREDPLAAAASGVNVRKYKVIAFVLSALYAGCAGSLKAHMAPGFLHPNSYTSIEMVTLLLMVVFGGIGHIWGGVIGAIVVTIIDDLTRDYYQYRMAMFGAVIVLTVMFMPRGIGGIIDDFLVPAPVQGDPQGPAARPETRAPCCLRSGI